MSATVRLSQSGFVGGRSVACTSTWAGHPHGIQLHMTFRVWILLSHATLHARIGPYPMSLWRPCGLHGFAVPNTIIVTVIGFNSAAFCAFNFSCIKANAAMVGHALPGLLTSHADFCMSACPATPCCTNQLHLHLLNFQCSLTLIASAVYYILYILYAYHILYVYYILL